ncbi:MAG: PIN domain-containing protein [Candidatus Pacearchaeota archaeon]
MAIVFDTYAWIEFFEGSKKGETVKNYLDNDEVITPAIVLLELSYKSNKEGWSFNKFFSFIKMKSKIVGVNDEFILSFGGFYNKMKKKEKKIGITDVIIMHTARVNNAKVLTGDPHFNNFKDSVML